MIKVPPIMELFQIIKIYISQPTLNFQKSYKRDQNMRDGGPWPRVGGPNKSNRS